MFKTFGLVAFSAVALFTLSGCFGKAPQEEPPAPTISPEEKAAMEERKVTLSLKNVSTDQPLSPGVIVVHTDEASLNFEGQTAPAQLEPLAEVGAAADFAAFAEEQSGVLSVTKTSAAIAPGETATVTISAPQQGAYLSVVMMAVGSNDGFVLIDKADITPGTTVQAANYDAGTEENGRLGGGFAAGQPDPEKGDENIDNGDATDPQAPVARHEQLESTLLSVTIAQAKDNDTMGEKISLTTVGEQIDELIENVTPLTLEDVEGGGGTGSAWIVVKGGKTYHRVTATAIPRLTNDDFYEGWLVKEPVPGGFVSTGQMVFDQKTRKWVLNYVSDSDMSEYRTVVITREPNDGDPAPAEHVIEATFGENIDFSAL